MQRGRKQKRSGTDSCKPIFPAIQLPHEGLGNVPRPNPTAQKRPRHPSTEVRRAGPNSFCTTERGPGKFPHPPSHCLSPRSATLGLLGLLEKELVQKEDGADQAGLRVRPGTWREFDLKTVSIREHLCSEPSPDFRYVANLVLWREAGCVGRIDVDGDTAVAQPLGKDVDAHAGDAGGHGDEVLGGAVGTQNLELWDRAKVEHLLGRTDGNAGGVLVDNLLEAAALARRRHQAA
mmetsp:Transcript_31410/g.73498  ORF Transcript_31410/g.73498 Transcript_31410/m.73498 type:complete len:234 (+) Transcript_31410:242-943(+)